MSEIIKYNGAEPNAANLDDFTFPAGSKEGLKWEWKLSKGLGFNFATGNIEEYVFFSWKFDWEELKKQKNIGGFEGIISAHWQQNVNSYPTLKSIKWTVQLGRNEEWIQKRITRVADLYHCKFKFDFELKPVEKTEEILKFESIFGESEVNDVALVVEGSKKMHVNKALLSYHSNFFKALFSSDFKEKSMKEIPIEDVKYENFASLLTLVTSAPIWPTENNIEEILKLADRFMMRAVPKIVEHGIFLLEDLKFETMIVLGDKYEMKNLIKKCAARLKNNNDVILLEKAVKLEDLKDFTNAIFFLRSRSF